jgi:hypothetical protein
MKTNNRNRMESIGNHPKRIALVLLALISLYTAPAPAVESKSSAPLTIELRDNAIILRASGIRVKDLLERIHEEMAVEIIGLESKNEQTVTFSYESTSAENMLRQLLRHLGEENFAYEFFDNKLVRIRVFPRGTDISPARPSIEDRQEEMAEQPPDGTTTVVEIVSVMEDTQAANLDLEKGDYIIQYDGRRLYRVSDLLEETSKNKNAGQVDIVIVRDGKTKRLFLEKGFIGIQIKTSTIPQNELPAEVNSW